MGWGKAHADIYRKMSQTSDVQNCSAKVLRAPVMQEPIRRLTGLLWYEKEAGNIGHKGLGVSV